MQMETLQKSNPDRVISNKDRCQIISDNIIKTRIYIHIEEGEERGEKGDARCILRDTEEGQRQEEGE